MHRQMYQDSNYSIFEVRHKSDYSQVLWAHAFFSVHANIETHA